MLRTYAIDNNQNSYDSNYVISYVEADPAVMEPLLDAFQKAWPRSSHPRTPRVIFTTNQVEWHTGGPMSLGKWINRLDTSRFVRDLAAAEEFRRLALTVETLGAGHRKWFMSLNFQLGEQ